MAALLELLRHCEAAGYPRERIVVSHQDLGRIEWPGARELVEEHCDALGLRLEVSKYRNRDGDSPDLLEYVKRRGKWPDNKNRYCTSDYKRGPGGRVITKLYRERPGDILQVFGFRADESPARSKKVVYEKNKRASTKSRSVYDWLPIHKWTSQQVWDTIRASGLRWHKAYDLGMPRLSCCFCVFAPKAALMIAGKENPGLLDEYVRLEKEIGHTFQNGKPIADVKESLERGEEIPPIRETWRM